MEIPDLSHLTEEEQQQILAVIKRQQDEEKKEKEMINTLREQFNNYKQEVKSASENAAVETKQSPDSTDLCALCHKTKIAEGCGHNCSYCSMKFCSRCGGRVTVKSTKNERMMMWVCNLCRKQQELLTKSGTWYRTEQNHSSLTLNLEPVPSNEILRSKISGSASLAQLEQKVSGNGYSKSLNQPPRLKKGASEPQLAVTEKISEDFQNDKKDEQTVSCEQPKNTCLGENVKPHQSSSATDSPTDKENKLPPTNLPSSRVTQGARRSSTHSQRRLYRQEQALGKQDFNLPAETEENINTEDSDQLVSTSKCLSNNELSELPPTLETYDVSDTTSMTYPSVTEVVAVTSNTNTILKTPLSLKEYHQKRLTPYVSASQSGLSLSSSLSSLDDVSNQWEHSRINNSEAKASSTKEASTVDPSQARDESYTSLSSVHLSDGAARRSSAKKRPSVSKSARSCSAEKHSKSPKSPRNKTSPCNSINSPSFGKRSSEISLPSCHCEDASLSFRNSAQLSHGRLSDLDVVYHCSSNSPNRKGVRRHGKSHCKSSFCDCEDVLRHNSVKSKQLKHHPKRDYYHSQVIEPQTQHGSSGDVSFPSCRHQYSDVYPCSRSSTMPQRNLCSNKKCSENRRYKTCKPNNFYHSDSNMMRHYYNSEDSVYSSHRLNCEAHNIRYRRRRHGYDGDCIPGSSLRRGNLKQKGRTGKYLPRRLSLSSTDEDLPSTPDYSSCDESDKRRSFVKEDGIQQSRDHCKNQEGLIYVTSPWHGDLDQSLVGEAIECDKSARSQYHKKVHFTSSTDRNDLSNELNANNIQNSKLDCEPVDSNLCQDELTLCTRDSGIDTGSSINTVHSDDVKDQQPVSWQPSPDGRFLIGHVVLNKDIPLPSNSKSFRQVSEAKLGLKVCGGKKTEEGYLAAFIVDVKKGSLADVVGHLMCGDEVIMWNDHCLRDASYPEVYQAVASSKEDSIVKLTVSRPIKDVSKILGTRGQLHVSESSSSSFDSHKHGDDVKVLNKKTYHHALPACNVPQHSSHHHREVYSGKIEVAIWHDEEMQQLYVRLIQAIDLSLRPGGSTRNPHVIMYMLPDRCESSKRTTKVEKKTLNPIWNQTVFYSQIRKQDLKSIALDVSVWDFDRSAMENQHFVGEVVIGLGQAKFSSPQWYNLKSSNEVSQTSSVYDGSDRINFPFSRTGFKVGSEFNLSQPTPRYDVSMIHPSHSYVVSSQPRSTMSGNYHRSESEANFSMLSGKDQASISNSSSRYQDGTSSVYSSSSSVDPCTTYGGKKLEKIVYPPRSRRHSFERMPNPSFGGPSQVVDGRLSYTKHVSSPTRPRQHRASMPSGTSEGIHVDKIEETFQQHPSSSDISRDSEIPRRLSIDDSSDISVRKKSKSVLMKSSSLGEDLHTSNKSHTMEPKRSGTPSGSPLNRMKYHNMRKHNGISHKITSLVGLKNRSKSSCILDRSHETLRPSARTVEYGIVPELQRDSSRDSASGSLPSLASEGSINVGKTFEDFIGKLGKGQVVGRQALVANSLGDIKLGFKEQNNRKEVQVIRAKNLTRKPNAKVLPDVHAKVYLRSGEQCVAKKKTSICRRTLEPRFNETVIFEQSQYGDSVEVQLRGDYGLRENKVCIGAVKVLFKDLDLSTNEIGWYRLFPVHSVTDVSAQSGKLTGSITSLENDHNVHGS